MTRFIAGILALLAAIPLLILIDIIDIFTQALFGYSWMDEE